MTKHQSYPWQVLLFICCMLLFMKPEALWAAGNWTSLSQRAPRSYNLLTNCHRNESTQYARKLAASWLEIVDHIGTCDIDSLQYFNSEATVGRLRTALAHVLRNSNSHCQRQIRSLERLVSAVSSQIRKTTPYVLEICQIPDHIADLKKKQRQLASSINKICSAMKKHGISKPGRVCK